jgi:hypothetical protein
LADEGVPAFSELIRPGKTYLSFLCVNFLALGPV